MTYNHYPVGWAHAMDTPFQWTKQVASHFGGTRNGLVISWPARIKDKGGIRPQFHHVIDIVPTILKPPASQSPPMLNGVNAEADRRREHGLHFDDANAPSKRTHPVFRDARQPRHLPRRLGGGAPRRCACRGLTAGEEPNPDDFQWELYHVAQGLHPGEQPGRAEPSQAQGAAGGLRHRGEEVQRLSARLVIGRAHGSGDPPQPDPRPQRVHVLPGHDPHSRGHRTGREEQVLQHHR